MSWIGDALKEWVQDMMIPGIKSNITGIFDATNDQVSNISVQIGQTPQGWNRDIYNMIKTLSDSVILPIAGSILAFVMTLELIQMITEKNNMQEIETWSFFKWAFRAAAAILIVTNTWTIVMGVFEAAQSVVRTASGLIGASGSLGPDTSELETILRSMDVGELLGIWIESVLLNLAGKVISIIILVVIYGRMIEIYLVTSVAPIPMATMLNRSWGSMGQNYLRSLLALAFQAVMIIVCVGIYYTLIRGISFTDDLMAGLLSCLGYSVLLCFVLFKTSSLSKSVFNAH